MSKKEYKITEEHLYSIKRLNEIIRHQSDAIIGLCKEERPDIVYGFELGNIYSSLTEGLGIVMELYEEIGNYND